MNEEDMIKEYILTKEDDDELMKNIDMDELKKAIEEAEQDILAGRVIPFDEAMRQVHKEVFGEDI